MIQQMDSTKLHLHTQRLYDWQQGKDIGPIHIDLGINNSCNNRCKHCYLGHTKHPNVQMPYKMMPQLFADMKEIGVKSVFFAGSGEPLLHPKAATSMWQANFVGLDVALATNGSAAIYPEDMAFSLKWVRFSIQGCADETYGKLHGVNGDQCQTVFNNLGKLKDLRNEQKLSCKLGVLTCLMPENLNEIADIARSAEWCGADYFTVRPPCRNPDHPIPCPVWDVNEIKDKLLEAEAVADENFQVIVRWNLFDEQCIKSYGQCLGLPFVCQIDANGEVYACGAFVGNPDYCYGNLHVNSLVEIWNSDRRKYIMNNIMNSPLDHCDDLCRLHNINKFLWGLKHPPEHVNFI